MMPMSAVPKIRARSRMVEACDESKGYRSRRKKREAHARTVERRMAELRRRYGRV